MDALLDWLCLFLDSLSLGSRDDQHRVRAWIHWRAKVFIEKRQQKQARR
ncbi:hypothetical protein [Schleiferilactobacillus harbinensis]|jgi:hypothetical protein|uniref:Uncharacterized protein n=1 Tax=Schleiferilactobacillus harbinensis TaxID=304207 RepID=A0ABU7SYB5_9LACO|nr:hypothetical protein [Schleiferilactobacillus harbinensis]MCI1688457.1 hypothetical protein [Schleiferilactobacillus harbinensis]MCI1783706.1 hypothetical protein [Schleiferilactobacillus harbinensis]